MVIHVIDLVGLGLGFVFGKNLFLLGHVEETGGKCFFHFIPEESGRNWNKIKDTTRINV